MPTKSIDLPSLIAKFGCEDKCRAYLEELRWPDGVKCPRCTEAGIPKTVVSRIHERNQFACDSCGYHFSVRVGTVLHDSKLPLWKWFLAVFLMVEAKKGVSANQIKRMLGVSYKTAWHLCHRIRAAMVEMVEQRLSGSVELDETFIGGDPKDPFGNKSVVIGAVERDGDVRLKVIPNRKRKTLHKFIDENVSDKAHRVYTDDWHGYDEMPGKQRQHRVINHARDEYVVGDVHTNTIESVWSLFKRSVIGTYHKLSKKHLAAYLDEMEWRFNNRDNPYLFRDTLIAVLQSDSLSYEHLKSR